MDKDLRCIRCGAILQSDGNESAEGVIAPDEGRVGRRFNFRPPRMLLLRGRVVRAIRPLRDWFQFPLPEDVYHRRPWVAGFLGLIPGCGQLYNYQFKKAFVFALGALLIVSVSILTMYYPLSNWVLASSVLLAAFGFHDALKTATQINNQSWTPRLSLAAYFAWIFYVGAFSLIFQFLLHWYGVQFLTIDENSISPFILKGDKIAIDKFSYRVSEPEIGDIVFYDPKPIMLEKIMPPPSPSMTWHINKSSDFERVVAGPGQTFSQIGGKFYRDGLPIGAEEGPILREDISWDFELTAPPDHYIILFTHVSELNMMDRVLEKGAPPALNDHGVFVVGWEEASIVHRDDIRGRAWFRYQPPETRRLFSRSENLDKSQ